MEPSLIEHCDTTPPERSRRVVAVVLPELLCELAQQGFAPPLPKGKKERKHPHHTRSKPPRRPMAVVLDERVMHARPIAAANPQLTLDFVASPPQPEEPTARISAVNREARCYGVCPGQTVAEAGALVARLLVRHVSTGQIEMALGKIAEVALSFGSTVSVRLPDTVLVDVTGGAHLYGGEEALALELAQRVRRMGHVAHLAVAGGPVLARSFARYGAFEGEPGAVLVIEPREELARLGQLPLRALPLTPQQEAWFVRLGVISVGDFLKLPRAAAAARLGESAREVLSLTEGQDTSPLVAYEPEPCVEESSSWDEPVNGVEPLLFVVRGLASRVGSRLEGRGKAAQRMEITVEYDLAIARHRGVAPHVRSTIELSTPLYRPDELVRVIAVKLRNLRYEAPSVGLRLKVLHMTAAPQMQLNLARAGAKLGSQSTKGPEALPILLAELAADIGEKNVGVLALNNSHRPERKCDLVSASRVLTGESRPRRRSRSGRAAQLGFESQPSPTSTKPTGQRRIEESSRASRTEPSGAEARAEPWREPTRLFPKAIPLHASLKVGASLAVGRQLFTIEQVHFVQRLQNVEWWSGDEVSRDYVRLWLQGAEGGLMALAYVDRVTGKRFLQAIYD